MAEQKEFRPLIQKLGQKITDRIGHKVTQDDPEYWGIACVVTDEMAELLLKMKVRTPYTMKELVKLTGKDEAYLSEIYQKMGEIGIIEWNYENKNHERQYVLPMFVPGCAEFMVMNGPQVEAHHEIADFFERMAYLPLEGKTQLVPQGGAGIGMHVIPVEKAIPQQSKSLDIEHISFWLNKYEGKYAVGACSCRRQQRVRGEAGGDLEGDWCVGVGDMADYLVETGRGHYITKDEAMEIFERAERKGYVHQVTNIDGEDKIFGICNCAVSVCNALRTSLLFNTPNLSRSAYRAHVDPKNCVACGRCVEVCPAGAARLGQKLCNKNGPQEYKFAPLPDNKFWPKSRYDFNYKDTIRKNVYESGTAPCKTACPAHLPVQGYIKMAAQGRYREALELIKQDNPFPAVCGSICNRRCEDACTRGKVDKALAIDEIKKFIANLELNEENRYIPSTEEQLGKEIPHKMAVIGAGPAGMTCAYFLRTMNYPVTVFERNPQAGGMLKYGVPTFRLEKNVLNAEIEVLETMGVEFKFNTEVGKDITIDDLRKQGYEAFYIAIGCQGGRGVGVPGEDSEGVWSGVTFLREAAQENSKLLSSDTVVIGGGNVAIDVSRTALRSGSSSVQQFCLESREIMPAADDEIEEAESEGIKINPGWGPKEIIAEEGKVKAIVLKKCLSVFDENHRFNPKYDENDTITVECSNIILSVGQSVVMGDLLKGTAVEFNRNGTIKADPVTYQTAEKDIFAGGDVYSGPRFAIDAIAAGREGCESMHRFVNKGHSLTLSRNLRQFVEFDKDNIAFDQECYDKPARQVPHRKDVGEKSFRDNRLVFTEEQLKAETSRCLGCGASVVDLNKCLGCGMCTVQCKFDAIHLTRDLPHCSDMKVAEDKAKNLLPYVAKRAVKILFNPKRNK